MLVIEWAPHNIRVNAVAPATVMTESRQQMLSHPKARANALSGIPCGWFATPDEIAAAVVYLASPAAGSVTGRTLALDGGPDRAVTAASGVSSAVCPPATASAAAACSQAFCRRTA